MTVTEQNNTPVKTILAALDNGSYDAEASIEELEELAKTANAEVVAKVIQKRPAADSATVLGEGKIEEIAQLAQSLEAGLLPLWIRRQSVKPMRFNKA